MNASAIHFKLKEQQAKKKITSHKIIKHHEKSSTVTNTADIR